jgi:hypothetical protein
MLFILTNHNDFSGRFAPCAADRLLLKTVSARVKHAVAQKVLLISRWLENRLVLSNLHRSRFKRRLMNTNNLKCHEVLRGETSGQKTQQPNLITKGRNQRQINE